MLGVRPVEVVVTWLLPATKLAMNVVAVATPLPFVVVDVLVKPLTKVPLGPLDGAVKVTAIPGDKTGLPYWSSTVELRRVGNAVPTVSL